MESQRDLKQRILTTPWCSSWVGRARNGDRYDLDAGRRASAWAHWAVESLCEMTGADGRVYPAMVLDGKFDNRAAGVNALMRPHLEVPKRVLDASDSTFPDRLSQLGNATAFPWWRIDEAVAVRRALFNTPGGDVASLCAALNARRVALDDALGKLSRQTESRWATVEEKLLGEPDELRAAACGDFSVDEVAEYFPAARDYNLSVRFDTKLAESAKEHVARRIGVWQLHGTDPTGVRFALGVVTPRLTLGSQFRDAHFAIAKESPAAMLVRGLVMRRLLERILGEESTEQVAERGPESRTYLRSVLAQVGQKMPEASVRSAVQFLQTYQDADEAWVVLEEWAARSETILTVREEQFREAHRRAHRAMRRAEDPDREDVNVVLPLGWDSKSRVVRVTFSKRQS